MQTIVKKWFREKDYGFLDNGSGPDIIVRKADLVKCQFLKAGTLVEFECHANKQGLIAKSVSISRQNNQKNNHKDKVVKKSNPFGVMT